MTHIAIIHRHGARYVCKEAFDLLKDTDIGKDWEKRNVGQLTETGVQQSKVLGEYFGKGLLKGISSDEPLWLSSNADRVINSGRAFFVGLHDSTSEEQFTRESLRRYIASPKSLPENLRTTGNSSRLLSEQEPDALFRAFKSNESYVQETNDYLNSPHFAKKADKELEFLERILNILSPEQAAKSTPSQMLYWIDALVGALECEKHMGLSDVASKLTETEIEKIYSLGRWIKEQLFFKLKTARTLGKPLLEEILLNSKKCKVSVYSAHDHTICSVLANLGLKEYPAKTAKFISFGAYIVLTIRNQKISEARFNPEPFDHRNPNDVQTTKEYSVKVRKTLFSSS